MSVDAPDRIRTLDLIRGVAVLSILTINIASFAAPDSAGFSPNLPQPGSTADTWSFAFSLVFLEGKMRALFSILFGASLLLLVERREAQGRDGHGLQLRRLWWLALIGWLHFALLWDGDVLFIYAIIGFALLLMHRTPPGQLLGIALALFALWQAWGVVRWMPAVIAEQHVIAGTASRAERSVYSAFVTEERRQDRADAAATLSPYSAEVAARLGDRPAYPLLLLIYIWGETLTYGMIGMALLKSGFFASGWQRRRIVLLAAAGTALGLAATTAFAAWAHPQGYPEMAMRMAIGYGLGFAHLLTALGYAALLVLCAPRLLASRLGQRLEAAGRMAFSNYLGTSLAMTALFSGWGLGLFGQYGTAALWLFVFLGWALMLGWSQPWLTRYRQGPLEWLWRSLTEWQLLPNRMR
ncbi:MAG: DUF418 domain-containing protein [Novosphingobium sp.]|nr:DUF418 domain-containing protein [Novosphingobium sp.]